MSQINQDGSVTADKYLGGMEMQAAWLLICLVQEQARVEDFEDRVRLDVIYDGWERIRSAGHPAWNDARLERDPKAARSGDHCIRMETLGGHTALRQTFEAAWPVDPDRPWRLRGWARLEGTRRNSARLGLVWLDARFLPLREDRSAPLDRPGEWTEIVLEVEAPPLGARRAAARLDFEGPDLRGECRFDRISLEPAALLRLRPAGSPPGVFPPGTPPVLSLQALGMPPSGTALRIVTTSHGGELSLRSDSAVAGTFELPDLPPGVYETEAILERDGAVLSRDRARFLVPSPWTAGPPAEPLCRIRFDPPSPHGAELAALAGTRLEPSAPASVRGDVAGILRTLVALAGEGARPGSAVALLDGSPGPIAALRVFHDLLSRATPRPDLAPHAFEKDGRIVLALWSDAPVERAIHYGPGVRLHPPLGMPRPLAPGDRVTLGPLPVFLSGIDPGLLRLLRGFEISDPVLPLQRGPILRELRLAEPVEGLRIRLLDPLPEGWVVRPRDTAGDLTILLPASASDGAHELAFQVSFERDGRAQSFRASRVVRVEPLLELRTESGGRAVRIANRSGAPRALVLRVRLPGRAEESIPFALPRGGERTFDVPPGAEILCEERGGDRLHARLR